MPQKLFPANNRLTLFLKYKRTIIYTAILILVAVGHHLLMQMPIESFRYIRWSIISMLSFLCLGGSIMLMMRKNGGRARTLFAFVMCMVGLTNLLSLIKGLTTGYAGVVEYKFLSLPMLIYGSVYAYIFLLYPLEALRPGWLTLRRATFLFLPAAVIPGIFMLATKMQHGSLPAVDSWATLLGEFWNFHVWLRLFMLVYPVFGLLIMLRYRSNYEEWCENNYASMENIDIKWLGDYIFGNLVITLSCEIVVLSDNIRSVLMHNIIFLLFFLYGFYRVLFQKNPYPEGYFKVGLDETKAEIREVMGIGKRCQSRVGEGNMVLMPEKGSGTNCLFADKLPEYREKLEQWMLSEKPHLRKDFKLTDTMEILPLNRSYLSRLFNEGYGESFYQFVMRYRIAESKHLLLSRSDLNITCIADLSGFSSPSVFGRAFTQEMSCSPTQWREKEMARKINTHEKIDIFVYPVQKNGQQNERTTCRTASAPES
ncbi:helix-turn-helix domain-containing protein [Proteiniphilum sp. UBA1028]|jgi:AraC-like DNA-binding protein|uniref:helix-turn-helix domain-containing protein n=1 Tax=Proteiniphilum sp. UBA1028 TaxID=1947251 RepID=UPI0025CC72C5|nr:AraC family transcriptional regulator [Proteiniphilum sp. UBA1028]